MRNNIIMALLTIIVGELFTLNIEVKHLDDDVVKIFTVDEVEDDKP